MKTETINFRIEKEYKDRLKSLGQNEERTVGYLARKIIIKFFEEQDSK